jgi:DNA-binding CsgD family transcriptional regulator
MDGSSVWQMAVFTIPSAIGALLSLVLLFVLLKKPSWLLFFFFLFYLIGVFHLAAVSITSFLKRSSGSFGLQQFWRIGLAISRLRFFFLILFVHSAYRFRATPALTGLMAIIVGLGIVLPFFVYSIIPNLMEIAVVLYAFVYWLVLYLRRDELSISSRRQGLLRSVLVCSGFFLTGILLDLLEEIPQASVYISILIIDFYPVYLVSIGLVMALWAVRDLHRPLGPRALGSSRGLDLSGLPVTKREREIIDHILRGETNASIADQLFISESTVKKHINNLFRKLEITSRWELLKLTKDLHPKA